MYIGAGLVILLTLILILTIYRQIYFNSGLNRIISVLDEVLKDNFNRRFFAGEQENNLKYLAHKLNTLMESYQNSMMENKNVEEMRKRMISDISHDIRTPLTSIQGYMQVLQSDKNLSVVEKEEYINIVVAKCQTLNTLVHSFFELSRLEEEETPISLDKVDINASIRLTMSNFYHDFENDGIEPEINLSVSPVYVYANSIALERVLQNLISNTLFYGREGSFFGISVEEAGNKVFVNIWDKGRGITPNELKYIFERSYTVRPSIDGKTHVSGLGLAIVKRLIEKQNGEISVSSIPYTNTVFSFYLRKYL